MAERERNWFQGAAWIAFFFALQAFGLVLAAYGCLWGFVCSHDGATDRMGSREGLAYTESINDRLLPTSSIFACNDFWIYMKWEMGDKGSYLPASYTLNALSVSNSRYAMSRAQSRCITISSQRWCSSSDGFEETYIRTIHPDDARPRDHDVPQQPQHSR